MVEKVAKSPLSAALCVLSEVRARLKRLQTAIYLLGIVVNCEKQEFLTCKPHTHIACFFGTQYSHAYYQGISSLTFDMFWKNFTI